MSKIDVLLKKATAFEKLALYSDRKTFLQRIAQDASVQQFPAAGGGGINAPYLPGTAPPVGPAAQPKPQTFLPGPGWQNIPEEALKGGPPSIPPPPSETQAPAASSSPTSVPASSSMKAVNADPYVSALQTFLSQGPWGLQKAPDGKLGPDTQSALSRWQEASGLNPSGRLDKETINALRPIIRKYTHT